MEPKGTRGLEPFSSTAASQTWEPEPGRPWALLTLQLPKLSPLPVSCESGFLPHPACPGGVILSFISRTPFSNDNEQTEASGFTFPVLDEVLRCWNVKRAIKIVLSPSPHSFGETISTPCFLQHSYLSASVLFQSLTIKNLSAVIAWPGVDSFTYPFSIMQLFLSFFF